MTKNNLKTSFVFRVIIAALISAAIIFLPAAALAEGEGETVGNSSDLGGEPAANLSTPESGVNETAPLPEAPDPETDVATASPTLDQQTDQQVTTPSDTTDIGDESGETVGSAIEATTDSAGSTVDQLGTSSVPAVNSDAGIEVTTETGASSQVQYFQVAEDSMSPQLSPGAIVEIVSATYSDGDIVVAQKNDGTYIIKMLDGDQLVPLGAGAYYAVADVTILGVATLSSLTAEDLELSGLIWNSALAETSIAPTLGNGDEGTPYQIAIWENLYWLSQNSDQWGKHFTQTANIAFPTEITKWDDDKGWTPIGNFDNFFTGTYNGQGYTISNLFINRPTTDYQGLFGYTNGATLTNIALVNVDVTGYSSVGGLVGHVSGGTISNSCATGAVTGSAEVGGLVGWNTDGGFISNSYATGAVTGTNFVGGLVGLLDGGYISNSYATGAVTGTADYVGGLVGWNGPGTTSNSYATGAVTGKYYVGGLAGDNAGTITNCYATGAVTGTGGYIGGLVGFNIGTISNSFYDKNTTLQTDTDKGEPKSTVEMKTQITFIGWDFTNTWAMSSPIAFGGYPTLRWTGGYAVEPTSGQIASLPNLVWVAEALALDPAYPTRWSGVYTQTKNINMWTTPSWDGGKGWTPIGTSATAFTGSYYGQGKTISNLFINRAADTQGLFGYTNGATLTKIALVDVDVTGNDYVGGLVGYNHIGTISNSYATGAVTGNWDVGGLVGNNGGNISYSYATGAVKGIDHVGGLVGDNRGTITNSYATGVITGTEWWVGGLVGNNGGNISYSYATGAVKGIDVVGGLVGNNGGNISNSYATGAVTGNWVVGGLVGYNGGNISNSYATGAVKGIDVVGGLVGYNGGDISNSYFNTQNTKQNNGVGSDSNYLGVTGLTTAQMKNPARYTGWGINTVVHNITKPGYDTPYPFPVLFWELGKGGSPVWYIYLADEDEISFDGDFNFNGFTFTLPPLPVTGRVLTAISGKGANPIITPAFVTGGSAADLGMAVAAYNQAKQRFEANKGTMGAADKAVAEVELAVAKAAILALDLSLAAQSGQAGDLSALIAAYQTALATLNSKRGLLTAEQIAAAEALLNAIANVISRFSS